MYDPKLNPYLQVVYKRNRYLIEADGVVAPTVAPKFDLRQLYQSVKSGFQKSYEASKDFTPEEIQMYEKYRATVDPVIDKAVQFANGISSFLKKWGIPIPLVIAAVTALYLGGWGAVPVAVLVYGVQRKVAGAMEWLLGLKHNAEKHECLNFSDYYHKRMLEDYQGLYDFGSKVGQFAGNIAGTATKYGRKAYGALASGMSSLGKTFSGIWNAFKADPKASAVNALKLAIVVAIAVASGGVAATAYKMLTSPESWSQIATSVASLGLGSVEEVTKTLADAAHQHTAHAVGHAADAAHGAAHAAHGVVGHAANAAHGAAHAAHGAAHAAHGAAHGIGHELAHFGQHAATDYGIHAAQRQLGKEGSKSLQALNIATGV